MPYLDGEWRRYRDPGEPPEVIPAGLWVPERHWDEWRDRQEGLSFRRLWDRKGVIEPADLEELASLSHTDRERHLSALGRDLGSVQRDNLFYTNFLEQLKRSPDDSTADNVVHTMVGLGFASAGWDETIGGPPPHMSPRPWKRVLDWLLKNLAKVGKFIRDAAAFLAATLRDELSGLSVAISLGVVPMPSLGVELSTSLLKDAPAWTAVQRFLENVEDEFARLA